ncbi:MAG TPA: phytanoyl-CoA dioxygenase family protein [Pyrinomonadaceae bacterium]
MAERSLQELFDIGFVIIRDVIAGDRLTELRDAYDSVVSTANPPDLSIGRTTTRVSNLLKRSERFNGLSTHHPILAACSRVIGQPVKLSTLHARTVHPHANAQSLHVDFKADSNGWPMLGFIFMVDDFRTDNGATRFVPGSHELSSEPSGSAADNNTAVIACGSAGSLILYNGSVWHGHTANLTSEPRRSIQGAYIRSC